MRTGLLFIACIILAAFGEIKAQSACVPLAQAVPGITLSCVGGTANRTGIAYNPTDSLYYSSNAGSGGYPMETFGITGGSSVASTNQGFDYRGMWWNPIVSKLEGNGYNTGGIYNQSLNATTGYALSGGTSVFSGNNQPNNQSCGDLDYHANEILYYNSNSIFRYNRLTNAYISSYSLTGTPAGTSLNNYTVVYTGCLGMEIGVFDYANKRVMLYDKATGVYATNVPLPASAPNPSSYKISYSNDLFWVYNSSGTWLSYRLFQACSAPLASLSALTDTTFCMGDSAMLIAGTDSAYSYQWQLNGNDIPGATDTLFAADTSGIYTVKISVSGGCFTISSGKMVTANALPAANITASGPTSICAGSSIDLMANTGPGLSWQWQLNGSPISGATDSSYSASSGGNYSVLVSNSNSCEATSASVAVNIFSLPAASLQPDGPTEFCDGGSVTLIGSGGLSYQWLEMGQPISGANSASLNVTTSGNYSVIPTDTNGCSDTSNTMLVTVHPNPVVNITPSNDTLFATSGFTSYQWLDLNGNPIAGETNDFFVATVTGTYSVLVTDNNGCSTNSIQILVVIVVGVEEGIDKLSLEVYPIPASETLFISLNQQKDGLLTLINVQGKVVYHNAFNASQMSAPIQIDLEGFSSGVYLLQVNVGDKVLSRKLVIR